MIKVYNLPPAFRFLIPVLLLIAIPLALIFLFFLISGMALRSLFRLPSPTYRRQMPESEQGPVVLSADEELSHSARPIKDVQAEVVR